jgi:hypothetical protein
MTRREQLLDRIRPVLVCPTCRRGLTERGGELAYGTCGLAVRRDDAFGFAGKRPAAHTIASGFAIEATQPGSAPSR